MYYPTNVGELSQNQMSNLLCGKGVRVKKGNSNVIHLTAQQIKKLDRAGKKGKAVTINFDPYQVMQHKNGGGVGKSLKNFGKNVKKNLGNTFDKEFERNLMSGLKVAGKHAIEQGIPIATTLASMALGDSTGMSGAMLGNVASQYASDAYEQKVGNGLFKSLHKAGIPIKKKQVMRVLKDTASATADISSQIAGNAIATYTGNPALGQQFAEASNNVAQSAIRGNLRQGLAEAKKMTNEGARRFAIEAVDDVIDRNLSGNERRVAQNLLANKYGSASDLIYDMSNMNTGTGIKLKKNVGRPRKKKGGSLYPAGYYGGALGPA